jgi:hypothetical protein
MVDSTAAEPRLHGAPTASGFPAETTPRRERPGGTRGFGSRRHHVRYYD